ncbi:hypothetical protein V6N13_069003 [Hibiscus sabdariffa]
MLAVEMEIEDVMLMPCYYAILSRQMKNFSNISIRFGKFYTLLFPTSDATLAKLILKIWLLSLQHVFTKEEINWSYIEFVDNQDVLDLIEKKPGGIIALLDEAWYAAKVVLDIQKQQAFHTSFTISHYAGEVTYLADLFLDKNKDYVVAEHQDHLTASKCSFVACLFPPPAEESSKSSKFSSIGSRFKGVLEAIRISCAVRMTRLGLKGYQIGKTKVFLRAGQIAELDARRAEVLGHAARTIQRQIRTYIARKEFISLRKAAIMLQSHWRGILACKLYEQLRREAAAVKIQNNFRRHIARESYLNVRLSAITLQTGLRVMTARNEFRFRKQTKAAIIVQATFRFHAAYSYYKNLQKAALTTQCGALKEAKDKLEKRVEELTCRLSLEKRLRTDLEEERAQEIAKLQDALHAMQLQVEEANERVKKEQEAARKAIEETPPVVKEIPVIVQDTEKIDCLTAEVESLKFCQWLWLLEVIKTEIQLKLTIKASLLSERKATEEARNARTDADARNAELVKKLEDSERKVDQLQESVQRLEEKLSNSQSEIQVLRQQSLAISPTGKSLTTRQRTMIVPRTSENGNVINGETKVLSDMTLTISNVREPESEEKPQTKSSRRTRTF